jgi:uncharacterized protein YndB with AHSA1/START domain
VVALVVMGVALAGSRWEGKPSDIVAERTIAASPAAVYAALDPSKLQALFPEDCAHWTGPFAGSGLGASTEVTYIAAGMHRRLQSTVKTLTPGALVELDHPGNKGFVTRFHLEPAGEVTKVTMTTYLAPPPGMIAGYFYNKVQPAWQGCHARTLEALEKAAGS